MTSSSSVLKHAIIFLLFSLLSVKICRSDPTPRREGIIKKENAAVATDDGRCSEIGMDILVEGGRAVDAAIAAALCLGVVSPASSGIGGGAFMLLRLANGTTEAIDMREVAPFDASENMYDGNATLKAQGPLSIAVPGQLAGLYEVWREHGKLPWKRLIRPAERLAREGFKISPYLYTEMLKVESGIFADKGLRDIYTINGKLLQPGEICYNKKLARTLRIISEDGAEAFYNGPIGFNLIKDIEQLGAIVTMNDLQNYKIKKREPIFSNILGLDVIGMPPPSSGALGMILMVNILAQYDLPGGISGPLGTHRQIEALKNVFAVRMNLGDPDFVNITTVESNMLSVDFAKELQKTIYDNMTFGPSHYGGKWNPINDHGTTHLSIVDHERNAVAMTCTVNYHFGAQILSPSTGILLNNEMDDFSMPGNTTPGSLPQSPLNFIRPGKRPLSSMFPTIILKNGTLKAVIGASGGLMIIPGVTESFLNHFVKKIDLMSSILAPRVYHQWIPNIVYYENYTSITGDHIEVPAFIREALLKKGHVLQSIDTGSVCQFITIEDANYGNGGKGDLVAVSDPRKGGYPAGY